MNRQPEARRSLKRIVMPLSRKQRELIKAYGTPAEFALACYAAVPSDVSMDEAAAALQKYQREWDAAA